MKDFQIDVSIEESQNITALRVPSLRNDIESETDAEGSKHKTNTSQNKPKKKYFHEMVIFLSNFHRQCRCCSS